MPMSGAHLSITSSIAMFFAAMRLIDYSVLVWVTTDFERDFPRKQFLLDFLNWKHEMPVLGLALMPAVVLFGIAKFDVFVALIVRTIQAVSGSKGFALRHVFDLFDIGVLVWTMRVLSTMGASVSDLQSTCDTIAEFRWNARAVRKTQLCEEDAVDLRNLYLTLLVLHLATVACPILRFQFGHASVADEQKKK